MKTLLPLIALLVLCGGCFPTRPLEAGLNRTSVRTLAERRASADGIDLSRFHPDRPVFVLDKSCWYVVFQENGMLLAAGDEFTVFVNDRSGLTRLVPDIGTRTDVRKAALAKMLEDLPMPSPVPIPRN